MPVFDYKCSCGLTKENKLVKHYKEVVYCDCSKEMIKVISSANLCGMNSLGQSKKE